MPPQIPPMNADSQDGLAFRNALGTFVTGVTIVTTRDAAGSDIGLTVNSFNSVSLDPPMILWSLALDSGNLGAFRHAPWWAVHVLASDQEALSARFAKRDVAKFEGVPVARGPGDIPLLEGCAARFICRTEYEYEGGDHAIFVGRVTEFDRAGHAPLVYHEGRYSRVLPEPTAEVAARAMQDDFGAHFLGHQLGRAHLNVFGDVRREYRSRGLSGADYTVLTLLGLGEGSPRAELLARLAKGGLDEPEAALSAAADRGLVQAQDGHAWLSDKGSAFLVELIAVAQASQMRIEAVLAPDELTTLRDILRRLGGTAA
jgi:3-hydroxy-9,10-secoandrosta-1,3,5(10)-triene-9,17-dione monooxygenase reductase component